jgi:hypothetical protein
LTEQKEFLVKIIGAIALTILLIFFVNSVFFNVPSGHFNCFQSTDIDRCSTGFFQRYISKEDTLAQWMAAILSAFSFFTSVLTIVVVYRTLKATQKMATDAREIGEAQSRAYLGAVECTNSVASGFHYISVALKNFGNTPADIRGFSVQYSAQTLAGFSFLSGGTGGGAISLSPNAIIPLSLGGTNIKNSFPRHEGIFLIIRVIVKYVDIYSRVTTLSAEFNSRILKLDHQSEPIFEFYLRSQSEIVHDENMLSGLTLFLQEAEEREKAWL